MTRWFPLATTFGELPVRAGDYVILPRSTTQRWLPGGSGPLRCYVIEANAHIAPPQRYLSRYGQFLEHAPYCERDLHGPGEPLIETVVDAVSRTLSGMSRGKLKDSESVEKTVDRAVRTAVNEVWGKKPACHVQVVEV